MHHTCEMSDRTAVAASSIPDFDAWWDYANPAATEARFLALLAGLEASANRAARAELLSQIARAQGFQRRFDEAYATLERARVDGLSARARARILLEEGRLDYAAGSPGAGVVCFRAALSEAESAGEEALAVDAAHMLGIVTPVAEQLAWNLRAIGMAVRAACPKARRWLGTLYMNTGWTHHDAGRFSEALSMFRAAETWMRTHGRAEQLRTARWNVARCLRTLGMTDQALRIQQDLLREHEAAGAPDGHVHEELGELLLMSGETEAAAGMFRKAHEILTKDGWRVTDAEAEALLRKARLCESG